MSKLTTADYFDFIVKNGLVESLSQYEADKQWLGRELFATDGLSCEIVKVIGVGLRNDDNHKLTVSGKILSHGFVYDIDSLDEDKVGANLYKTKERAYKAMSIYLDKQIKKHNKSISHFEERKVSLDNDFKNNVGIWKTEDGK